MSQTANDELGVDGWGVWSVISALVLATVLAVITFALTSDGGETVQAAADETTQVAPPTTLAPPPTEPPPPAGVADTSDAEDPAVAESSDLEDAPEGVGLPAAPAISSGGDAGGFESSLRSAPYAAATQITDMGPTEVGFTTNFPTVDYTWQRIEMPGPGVSHQGWLGTLGGQFVAIAPSWGGPYEPSGQSLTTKVSADGLSWEQAGSYPLPDDVWIGRIVSDGEQAFAIAHREVREPAQRGIVAFVSTDGIEWSMIELPIALEDDQHVYVQDAAAGPAGVLVAINMETYPAEPPRTLVFDGYEVNLDYARSTYVLTDSSNGDELMSGRLDDLFNWGGEGQVVWNPDTGEVVTIVPWEIWERAWSGYPGGGTPLPLPMPGLEPTAGATLTVEHDGYVITVDEREGRFAVADAETGDEVTSGTLDELYQGPAPRFVDPATGEVYLSVSWDEWYQAEERSWDDAGYPEGDHYYRSQTALATSPDGESWSVEYVSDGDGGHVSFVAPTADGFITRVNTYGEFGERASVWTLSNGIWSSTQAGGMDIWLSRVVTTESGLIGVGEGSGGPALWTSADGLAWSTEFAIVPQDDGSHAWMPAVASDDAGTLGALVTKERWGEYQPLVIEQDEYTATFEDGDFLLRITETASGEVVLSVTWQDIEEDGLMEVVSWEDGVTTIDIGNGDVMTISDDAAIAAMDDLYSGSNEMGISVFLGDGSGWVEAVVDAEGGISGASQLFIVDGRIFIAGNYWGEEVSYREFGPSEDTFILLVGAPAGG